MRTTHKIVVDGWRDQLPRLRVFEHVARLESFTAAARLLGLSQPAVSRAVAALENHLGAALLERDGRKVTLTEAGRTVFDGAQRVGDELERITKGIKLEASEPRGDFFCYAAEHVASHLLGGPAATLTERYPRLVPRVVTAPAHFAVTEVAEDRAEIGFFFKAESHARTESRVIAAFPCKLVVHPAARRDEGVLTSFIGSREVDDRRNTSFPTLDMLRKHRPKTAIRLSSNSLALHKAWVLRKLGISILPLFLVEQEIASGALRVVHPEWTYWADLFAIVRTGRVLSAPARMLLGDFRVAARELGGKAK